MQNNNKKSVPEPLMFIHTVSTPIMTNESRSYFDSRDYKNKKNKINYKEHTNNSLIDQLLLKKIKNIIQMHKQGNMINCMIETLNNESYEGIPFDIVNNKLLINQNNNILEITLNEVYDVIILKL